MITVHYLNNSRAHRILWLLEELGVPYDVKTYQRRPDMRAPESLKAIHPLGKSPVVTDGDLVLAESGAITEYFISSHPEARLAPERYTPDHLRYTYWLHYAEGSAMPILQTKLIFAIIPDQVPFFIRPIARAISNGVSRQFLDPQIEDHVALWEKELSRDGWFAGKAFTAADILMSFPVEAGASRIDFKKETPAIAAYIEAIRSRPAYQRALERGGAYNFAKAGA